MALRIHTDSDGRFLGVELTGLGSRSSGLGWWSAPGGRSALATAGRDLAYAKHHDDFGGATLIRGEDAARGTGVLPPFTAYESRKLASKPAPELAFARLIASRLARCLRPGQHRVLPLVRDRHGIYRARWAHPPDSTLHGLEGCASRSPIEDIDYGLNGSGEAYPLRTLPAADNGRVRALRKLEREGALAPLVFLSAHHLTAHLLLDGHERLVAALEEGVAPTAVTLVTVRTPGSERHAGLEAWRSKATEVAARQLDHAGPSPSRHAVDVANRRLTAAFAQAEEAAPDAARAMPNGTTLWETRVQRRLAALGDATR